MEKIKSYLIAGLITVLATGCGASWHLKQSKRHKLKAIQLGAVIVPDTVFKEVLVNIPPQKAGDNIKPVLDTAKFKTVIEKYDSAVLAASGMVSSEQYLKAQRLIKKLRGRIIKGFSKDSTYTFKPDSATIISVWVKDGLVDSVASDRKESKVKANVPVTVTEVVSAEKSWMSKWWIWLLVGFGVGIILALWLRM